MSTNPFQRLINMLPKRPLQVGVVASTGGGTSVITLPDGNDVVVRGSASVGASVFFRDGVIEGTAPALTVVEIEV
jgi:hypothetical protein